MKKASKKRTKEVQIEDKKEESKEPKELKELQELKEQSEKDLLPGFDMTEYLAKPNLDSGIVIRREITTIPAKRPSSQRYFKIHPTMEVTVDVLEWKEEGTLYLVRQDKVAIMFEQTKRVILHLGAYPTGSFFLFPVPQPDARGSQNPWHKSAAQVVRKAKKRWIRIQPDKATQGYIPYVAEGKIPPPEWPDKTMAEILSIAFADAIIDNEDHPIVKQLRGLA